MDVLIAIRDSGQTLPKDVAITFLETFFGLVLATAFSLTLALAFYFSWPIEDVLMPYAVALKSIPVVAMAPLLVIWTGNGIVGKIVLASIVSFFPLLIGFRDGLHSKPIELDHVAQVWAKSKLRVLLNIDLPLSIPSALSALKIAAPLSLVGAVVAEFSGANSGLGHVVIIAAYRADVALLFAGVIVVSLLGILMFQVAVAAEVATLKAMRMSRAD
ncbi:hypothetical protein TSA1_19865 [Bradyrhizobium nitroreducens]|uniref:ABC transmembrane type-1 domain-containing protein n=1 Tax=Bradyrhizobium nitroreducens TaxID=709803 RepID=A0A2M6UDS9_9BRAD|nr:ABC transporter permease subunit [Bradyrhizobium nitroreducens]PIT02756.1 hypothetical protein TSA1_19865 [Bradyrhizobium nitroreducens]